MIYIDAIYYAFLLPAGKVKDIKKIIRSHTEHKYVTEGSVIKSYLKRNKERYTNFIDASETLNFISKYII